MQKKCLYRFINILFNFKFYFCHILNSFKKVNAHLGDLNRSTRVTRYSIWFWEVNIVIIEYIIKLLLQTILIEKRHYKITPDMKTITAEMDFTFMYCVVQNLQMYTYTRYKLYQRNFSDVIEGIQLFMVSIMYCLFEWSF